MLKNIFEDRVKKNRRGIKGENGFKKSRKRKYFFLFETSFFFLIFENFATIITYS